VRVQLAREAFGSADFDVNLFSLGAAQSDSLWEPHLEGVTPFIEAADGTRVPLAKTPDNTWELECEIEPWSQTQLHRPASFGEGPRSTLASVASRLNLNGRRARQPAVRWPKPFAAVGVEATSSKEEGKKKKKSVTAEKQAELERAYAYHHQCFNHQDGVVDEAIRRGLIEAVKPAGWRCAACGLAKPKSNHFGNAGREETQQPLGPWRRVQIDLYGPVKCNDRNGNEYLFAAICDSTGAAFLQPLRAKSEAVKALRAFAKWVALLIDLAEVKLRYLRGTLKLGQLRSDRGGEFTTTWGATASEFDEVAKELFQGRWFGSPGVPQSATPQVERYWGTLRAATNASMISSKMPDEFKYYAACYANHIYNRSLTSANRLGDGEAPFKTLGADEGLQRLVPFGNPCVVMAHAKEKGDIANVTGRIIGIPSDGPGYIVALDPDPTNPSARREVISSVDVVPRRGGLVWDTDEAGDMVKQDPLTLEEPVGEYVLLPTPAVARQAETMGPALTIDPVVQTVGAAPGDAGSRAALRSRVPHRSPAASNRELLSKDAAVTLITQAATTGQAFAFRQDNPKTGASSARYEVYKSATTFDELAAMETRRLPDGQRVIKVQRLAKSGDFVNDVRHHFVEFLTAAPVGGNGGHEAGSPLIVGAGVTEGTPPVEEQAAGGGGDVPAAAQQGDELSGDDSNSASAPWKGRL